MASHMLILMTGLPAHRCVEAGVAVRGLMLSVTLANGEHGEQERGRGFGTRGKGEARGQRTGGRI